MNKFFLLTKINLIAALRQMNFVRRRASDKHGSSFYGVVALVLLALMIYAGWLAYNITSILHRFGLEWVALAALLFLITVFVFSTNLYTVNSVLFESSDTEQLFAYPLPKYQILLAKIFGLVAENWLVAFALALPFICVYSYYVHPQLTFYLYVLICILISPLIPLCLIAIIAYLVSALTSGSQFKNYFNLILTVCMLLGVTFGIKYVSKSLHFTGTTPTSIINSIKSFYPPMGYAISSLYNYSLIDMLIAVAWNLIPFMLLCGILSTFYAPLRSRVVATKKVKGGKLTFSSSSKLTALIKKEYARFFHSPMYILNSCIGVILITIFSITFKGLGYNFQLIITELSKLGASPIQIVLIIFLAILSLSNITAPSISLEGKNLWIAKSSPVRGQDVLTAKLFVHIITLIPFVFVDSIIVAFTMKIGFWGLLIVLLLCSMFVILSGLVGLIYNLHFHRFDFINDMQVVKNSASVLLTLITQLATVALVIFAYWLVNQVVPLNFYAYVVIMGIVVISVIVYLYNYICTKGEKLFLEL